MHGIPRPRPQNPKIQRVCEKYRIFGFWSFEPGMLEKNIGPCLQKLPLGLCEIVNIRPKTQSPLGLAVISKHLPSRHVLKMQSILGPRPQNTKILEFLKNLGFWCLVPGMPGIFKKNMCRPRLARLPLRLCESTK